VEAGERSGHFFSRLEARAALADLRIQQGRLAEAEQLLLGLDDRVEALAPLARLYGARGDHELAVAVARRGVRLLGADRLRAAPLLLAAVAAELGRGDLEAAAATAAELTGVATKAGQPTPIAQAALATARVAAARERPADAVDCLEEALACLGNEELPLLRAAIHFALARLHAGDHARALAEARAALALHGRVGAPVGPDEARLLRDLGTAPPCGVAAVGASLRRDGAYWTVRYGEAVARLRAAKGLAYLAELLAHPGVERHVFDLVDLVEGTPTEPRLDRRHLGDAGPCLDAQAKHAYRHRLEQLREAMDEADAWGDQPRAEKIQAEIDALVGELSRAMGLGGRDRRAASAAEKARLNVTRALRTAISRIQQAHPSLGDHLDQHVRTGMFCSYQPDTESGVIWMREIAGPINVQAGSDRLTTARERLAVGLSGVRRQTGDQRGDLARQRLGLHDRQHPLLVFRIAAPPPGQPGQRAQQAEHHPLHERRRARESAGIGELPAQRHALQEPRHALGVGLAVLGQHEQVADHQQEPAGGLNFKHEPSLIAPGIPEVVRHPRRYFHPHPRPQVRLVPAAAHREPAAHHRVRLGVRGMDVLPGDRTAWTDVYIGDQPIAIRLHRGNPDDASFARHRVIQYLTHPNQHRLLPCFSDPEPLSGPGTTGQRHVTGVQSSAAPFSKG